MPSIKTLLAVAVSFVAAVHADYIIDPDSVPLTTREGWCASEISTCPVICRQTKPYTTKVNTCDPTTLTYGCICGNGMQPNVTQYSLTMPYFVCAEWGNQCVLACGADNSCSSDCRQKHPCGAQNPVRANATTASATDASATGSSTATASDTIYTGLGSGSSSGSSGSSSSSKSAAVSRFSSGMGLGLTLGGLAAGFFLL